jgi:VWFA-related protein
MVIKARPTRGLRLLAIILAVLLSGTWPISRSGMAQEAPVHLKADLVLVPVAVTAKKTGLPVAGLRKEDFVLFDEGVPQKIVFLGQDDLPLSLLLLVEARFFENVARAARVILDRLKPEDEVAMMIFHGSPCLVQKFTTRKEAILDILEELASKERSWELYQSEKCWGEYYGGFNHYSLLWTSIYEAVTYTLHASERGRRRALLVFTFNLGEGDPEMSEQRRRELRQKVLERLYASDIVVSGVVTSRFYVRFIWGVMGRPLFKGFGMDELVEITGGRMGAAKPGELPKVDAVARLIEDLRGRYVLGYEPTDITGGERLRRIKVELSPQAKKKYKGVELRYRQGYIRAGHSSARALRPEDDSEAAASQPVFGSPGRARWR